MFISKPNTAKIPRNRINQIGKIKIAEKQKFEIKAMLELSRNSSSG